MNRQESPATSTGSGDPLRLPTTGSASNRRRRLTDRGARWVINAGGLAIIVSVLGILLFILLEVWPLFQSPSVRVEREFPVPGPAPGALLADEHGSHVALLGPDGVLRVIRVSDGRLVLERRVYSAGGPEGSAGDVDGSQRRENVLEQFGSMPAQDLLTASTRDGSVLALPVRWRIDFDEQTRVTTPEEPRPVVFRLDPERRPLLAHVARLDEEGSGAAAGQLQDRTLVLVERQARTNLLTGEVRETFTRRTLPAPRRLSRMVMGADSRNLFGGTSGGEILWWRLDEDEGTEPEILSAGSRGITAMELLIGDRSLVVGQADGTLSVWFPVRAPDGSEVLTRIRDFPAHPAGLRLLAASRRLKGFLALDDSGTLGLYHSTSHRTLWRERLPLAGATGLAFSPKGDGAFAAASATLYQMAIRNRHPEVSLGSLFARVWYEGYPGPEYVWQSSSATDEFEPKLSLTPLAVGTLKGTFYSLLLAVPLGVLGAMYASQFMHPSVQRYVKPTVEIMAALPSVVIGFIAGLWLAPRVERLIPAMILMVAGLPLLVLAGGLVWDRFLPGLRKRLPAGTEVVMLMLVLALGVWVCVRFGPVFEGVAFGGDFQAWLYELTGLRYDQRNAIVVGLAMGFAVIPVIFAISEDAFSNVPRHLISGSLALGANQWQTVTRVVLPMASPGIFSAIMIGFGRAVGETMIVLMATGNTPLMDWSPFNGFRTLSANIAVEIPEAPQGETLYRTLFLAALLLFMVTFIANTAAEVVRLRLRRKYSQL